ncbi:MAG: hypothetical protein ACE5JX_01115 [Acidobacteriota bacterium]
MPDYVTNNITFLNPVGLGFTLLMGFLMIVLPRRYALLPVILLICYMTMGMRVIVATFDFTMLRILILFGWARLILRGEIRSIKLNSIDKAVIWWALAGIITYTVLWQTYDAFEYKLGVAYTAIGFFFLFRLLLRDLDDVVRVVKMTALFIVPLAGSILVEKITGRNSFAIFGGVPPVTFVRNGILRCQGPFAHPILAGTFGATLLPLFVGLWWRGGRGKSLAFWGIASSLTIVVCAASSGPVLAALAGIGALCMWPLRKKMRMIRWGVVLALFALALVMKAPVWYIITRLSIFSGSTGWHRAYLIDRAIKNLPDWWLIGTKSTAAWGRSEHDGLADVTNQYISEGANGGLITMFLFIAIIVRGFRGVGHSIEAMEKESRSAQLYLWALGAALFAHAVNYIGVSYFDQNLVNWYMLLAMISTLTGPFLSLRHQAHVLNSQPRPHAEARPHLLAGIER